MSVEKELFKEAKSRVIINSKVKSYAKDPFFVKKADEAKQTIKRVGLPRNKKK